MSNDSQKKSLASGNVMMAMTWQPWRQQWLAPACRALSVEEQCSQTSEPRMKPLLQLA